MAFLFGHGERFIMAFFLHQAVRRGYPLSRPFGKMDLQAVADSTKIPPFLSFPDEGWVVKGVSNPEAVLPVERKRI
jgi:hypothetical protein